MLNIISRIIFIATLTLVHSRKTTYFQRDNLNSDASIQTLYTQDTASDKVIKACLSEMYPRNLYKYPLHIDRNDVPCIIHCVFRKFGIMNGNGAINIKNYYRRVQAIHKDDPRILISDVGETCANDIRRMDLDHDVCRKAKIFNECTQLFVVSLRETQH